MENGESTASGAARETLEEAGAEVTELVPFMLIDVPDVHQVHLFFRATLVGEHVECGDESLEVRLFDEHELPWSELSFPTVIATLRQYFRDRAAGRFGFHRHTISRSAPAR